MALPHPFITTLDCERFEGVLFEGFPYLIVHAAVGINHIILLPRGLGDHSIQWIAHQQRNANRLPVSLVLSADRSIVYLPDGTHVLAFEILFPGFPVSGTIEACARFNKGEELAARARALEEFIAEHPIAGFRFGNPWKGGTRLSRKHSGSLAGVMTTSHEVSSAARHAATGKKNVSIPLSRNDGGRTSSSWCPVAARTGTAARAATRGSSSTASTQTSTIRRTADSGSSPVSTL